MNDDHGRTMRGLRSLLSVLLLVMSTVACESGPRLKPEPPDPGTISTSWRSEPHSWSRLQAIEEWLLGPGPGANPALAVEAELLLAEGRLRFARSEAGTIPASAMAMRLNAAGGGFRRVLANPGADRSFADRARRGLASVQELQGVAPVEAGLPGLPGLASRAAWGARSPDRSNLTVNRNPWTRLTVHHTAMHSSTLGRVSPGEIGQAIQGIQRQHMVDRGFGDIGYHFLVDPRGGIWAGRDLTYQGAHALGSNNIANLGICLLGNFEDERPTAAALSALERLVNDLRERYGIPRNRVYGHRDFTSTACPGRNLMAWVRRYKGNLEAAAR